MKKYIISLLVMAAALLLVCGMACADVAKLTASDGVAGDYFGPSVSVSGDTAIVGAYADDSYKGAAYIYRWNGTTWAEEPKLTASDGAANDYFGQSVSISGDAAIVGAYGDDTGKGAAYIYRWNGTTWGDEQKLTASDGAANDDFGNSVSISGDMAIVGAHYDADKGLYSGSVYIYRWNGTTWGDEQKLTASDGAPNDEFGNSVSMSGDVVIVGARYDDDKGSASGSVYIYRWNGTTWGDEQKLTASDGAANDNFGYSVSVSGDVAIVGAKGDDDRGTESGSAYIYRWNGTTWGDEQKLMASDGAAGDFFGWSVSIDGDAAIVGAYGDDSYKGAAYIYRWNGTTWVEEPKLTASDGIAFDDFGYSVSVSGDAAIIGAYGDDSYKGSAYLYYSCTYNISPTEKDYDATGGTGSVTVTTSSWCDWTAVSNASWIHITAGASGAGDGTVEYAVEPNVSADSRTGTMTIAGETFTVTQDGITPGGDGGGGGCFINTLLY